MRETPGRSWSRRPTVVDSPQRRSDLVLLVLGLAAIEGGRRAGKRSSSVPVPASRSVGASDSDEPAESISRPDPLAHLDRACPGQSLITRSRSITERPRGGRLAAGHRSRRRRGWGCIRLRLPAPPRPGLLGGFGGGSTALGRSSLGPARRGESRAAVQVRARSARGRGRGRGRRPRSPRAGRRPPPTIACSSRSMRLSHRRPPTGRSRAGRAASSAISTAIRASSPSRTASRAAASSSIVRTRVAAPIALRPAPASGPRRWR